MRWGYKLIHYPLKKEGLLGDAFLDEEEVEQSLNQYGKSGWELVNVVETVEGLTAVFKQPLTAGEDFFPAAFETPVPRKKITQPSPSFRQEEPEESGQQPVEKQILPETEPLSPRQNQPADNGKPGDIDSIPIE